MSQGHPGQHRPSFPTAIRQRCPAQTRHSGARAPGSTPPPARSIWAAWGQSYNISRCLSTKQGSLCECLTKLRTQCSVDSTDRKVNVTLNFRVEVLLLPTSRLPPGSSELSLTVGTGPSPSEPPLGQSSPLGSGLGIRELARPPPAGSLCNFPGFVPGTLGNTCL